MHMLITGPPGVGKTTLIKNICANLQKNEITVQGFYTEEIRKQGRRTGFDVVTFDGKRGPLARIAEDMTPEERSQLAHGNPQVGRYVVNLQSFEQNGLSALQLPITANTILVVDEIGKMEMFSRRFQLAVRSIFDNASQHTVIATIPISKRTKLVEELIARQDVRLFSVERENRDNLVNDIAAQIMTSIKK